MNNIEKSDNCKYGSLCNATRIIMHNNGIIDISSSDDIMINIIILMMIFIQQWGKIK